MQLRAANHGRRGSVWIRMENNNEITWVIYSLPRERAKGMKTFYENKRWIQCDADESRLLRICECNILESIFDACVDASLFVGSVCLSYSLRLYSFSLLVRCVLSQAEASPFTLTIQPSIPSTIIWDFFSCSSSLALPSHFLSLVHLSPHSSFTSSLS